MANPDDVTALAQSLPDAELDAIRQQLNNVIVTQRALTAKLDVLTAKLNADAGVTDTNYATNFASTLTDSGVTTAPAKVTRING